MSNRPLGGYRGASPSSWSATSRTGEWDGAQQFKLNKDDQWPNPSPEPSGTYEISRSIRLNSADSAFLSRTPGSAGNRKTWTWAGWVKRCRPGNIDHIFNGVGGGSPTYTLLYFFSGNTLDFDGGGAGSFSTTQVFRDFSAWYHIVLAFDTTQATSSNRIRLWVNGQQVTAFNSISYPTQNADGGLNQAGLHKIGNWTSEYSNFYLADIHFIDGQALDPTSFGEFDTNGVWQPKAFSGGSYGTNGFRLTFSDNSGTTATTLGKDAAGSNNFTPNNFSVASGSGNDSLVDSPTSFGTNTGAGGEVRGNYATWNPLDKNASFNAANGNLDANASAGVNGNIRGTIGVSSGKWYWEYLINNTSPAVGIATAAATLADFPGVDASGYSYTSGGQKWNSNSGSSYGATYTTNDIIGVALDLDAGTLVFYKNGVSQGTAYSGLPVGTYFPAGGRFSGTFDVTLNAGARPFAYTAPSGFKALCDTNLPAPVVAKPSTVMDVKLYTGNGSTQTVSGLNFSPDLVWIKSRSQAVGHFWYDQIRGAGKFISSDSTNAEADFISTLSGFTSDGFGLGSNAGVNNNTSSYVAWAWDAGSSTVTNTAGSITSQVRANASAGFSVIGWTGASSGTATIGHGLGVAPAMIITRPRNATSNWVVYHRSVGNDAFLRLNTTDASVSSSACFGTGPTSTVFTLNQGSLFAIAGDCIGYAFAPVAGYSSFGSYTGNGSADGPFVYTGFRPRWIMLKSNTNVDFGGSIVASSSWYIYDAARGSYNANGNILAANKSFSEENNATDVDFLSNGFKLRNTRNINPSGTDVYYAAFAESPFQYARAR